MKLQVFYHLYIPDNNYAMYWIWWVDSQLGIIKDSYLSEHAQINMCITMPKAWSHFYDVIFSEPFNINSCTFEKTVVDYITIKYPFVNILEVRDTSEPNIYEGHTLKKLHEFALTDTENSFLLYFHSKGSGFFNRNPIMMKTWKDTCENALIKNWTNCIQPLFETDVVGVAGTYNPNFENIKNLTCNFWWSKSSYIKTLPEPIDSSKYLVSSKPESYYPGGENYRYAFEEWIHLSNPRLTFVNTFDHQKFYKS